MLKPNIKIKEIFPLNIKETPLAPEEHIEYHMKILKGIPVCHTITAVKIDNDQVLFILLLRKLERHLGIELINFCLKLVL